MRLLRLLCTYYTEVQYYNKTSFTEQRSWENRTNQPSMEWWSPRLEAGQSAELAGPLWRYEHIQRGGRGYQSHNLCLYTNLLNFTCSLVTHQTGDSYLCIVCVWFTFSCTLVPKSFVIIGSFICMVQFIHIGTLSVKMEITTRTRERRNIGFTILNEPWCIIIRDPVPARQLALLSSLQWQILSGPVYVTRLQPHFQ